MASSIVTHSKETADSIIASVKSVAYTFRGEWKPNTSYKKDDYVYSAKYPGFLYVATNDGTSQSETEGLTTLDEPLWSILNRFTYDGALQFTPVVIKENEVEFVRRWKPSMKVEIGELVSPSTGPVIAKGSENQIYVFKLKKCITNLDWPREPRAYMQDNDITWECRISYGKLLPAARLKEPMYKELVEIMDFLHLHEEIYFDDLTYKYADQLRTRATSIKEVMAEFGYNYITNFLSLSDDELRTCLEYIALIHYLKGSESGLSLIFELIGVSARWEEWWQENPKGEPDTWRLWVDVDMATALSALPTRIINFTRQYVYPVMKEFEVSYKIDIFKLGAAIGGFIDRSYFFDVTPGHLLLQGVGGFLDRSYSFTLKGIVHHVIGKEDFYLNQVFGFMAIEGRIGTWGSMWCRFMYNTRNRTPIVGDEGYPKGDGYDHTDITHEEAFDLLSADPCVNKDHNHPNEDSEPEEDETPEEA